MKSLFISILLLAVPSFALAIDKEEALYYADWIDTIQDNNLTLSKAFINENPSKALLYISQAIVNTENNFLKAKCYIQKGIIYNYSYLNKSDSALQNLIAARDIYLENDIRTFQARHGLEADGVIGKRSFQALNRTAEHRVDQLKLSLERGRWLMRDLNEDFILVNIAGARAYLVRADGTLWTTRSITGSQYRKTPVFRDKIKYMEFNPTWTVPRSIFLKDKLAKIRQDPVYLERNNYVVKQSNGDLISPKLVNWSSPNPNVTLMQKPGPNNALGLVKFMFPNQYAVYLHDTNDKSLFNRNQRNLSSGCVRLEYPFELAMLLMEDDPDWSFKRMQAILDSKKTTRINLLKPIPVLLTYWTSWVEENQVHFREDIYDRDTVILNALKNK